MILSDREIEAALTHGFIKIHPVPDRELWTSTALDLTLDRVLLEWDPEAVPGGPLRLRPHAPNFNLKALMDDPRYATRIPIDPTHGYELQGGRFVLGFTREIIHLPNRSRVAARVEGKSSLARLGVGIHVTAPTIHAGFGFKPGQPEEAFGSPIQLEIFNLGKITVVLDVGMPICQLILEEVREVPVKGYQGRFTDQSGFHAGPPSPGPGAGRKPRGTKK
jgi:dCTP deaminase